MLTMHLQHACRAARNAALLMALFLVISTTLTACGGSSSSLMVGTVTTSTGTFSPVTSPSNPNVHVYFGIRYAAAPVGALRWAPPTAPVAPTATEAASVPGNACPQPAPTTPIPQSEDCLFLNVWIPVNVRTAAKLPVFFWIHGGSLLYGTGATYDPSTIVQNSDVIVVTINYRLGALGWLVEPGLAATSASTFQNSGDAGNYGLMDQQFAMQWVRANIGAFGGDPTKVTIGGESAGGLSVTANLTSTATAAGLFRAAIIESGGYMLHYVPTQSAYQTEFGAGFDSALGCTPPSDGPCLRNASVSSILTAQGTVFGSNGISPDTGTKILPSSLITALTTGAIVKVPVLQGTNANEGRLFEPALIPTPVSSTAAEIAAAGGPANFDLMNPNDACASGGIDEACTYPQEINVFLAELGIPAIANTTAFDDQLAGDYPLANFPDPYLANNAPSSDEGLSQIFTDLVFACNGLDSNTALSKYVTVYGYEFNDPNAPPLGGTASALMPPNDVDGFPSASAHASELPFIFAQGALIAGTVSTLSEDEQQLAAAMKTYWGNFIVTNNPNSAAVPNWPAFATGTHEVQDLIPGPQTPTSFATFPTEHFCATWEPFIAAE